MRLTLSKALMLALLANLLPGCERSYADREEASRGATAAGGATAPADAAPPETPRLPP
jgi:hypothetical protein